MPQNRIARWAIGSLVASSMSGACDAYDPPPEVAWVLPAAGFWSPEAPLTLEFSEPIAPDSLTFDIVPDKRNREGDMPSDVAPLAAGCRLSAPTCGALGVPTSELASPTRSA